MILAIRTDSMDATIALINDGGKQIAEQSWSPARRLSNELLPAIEQLLGSNNLTLADITGLIAFQGPGSFTSLRIGITVANTLAYSLNVPIVAVSDDDWIASGIKELDSARPGQFVFPEYGAEANVTKPKK